MNARPIRLEQALDALPELDDLDPLREALLDLSRPDSAEVWAGSRMYATVGRRLADPGRLEIRVQAIAERVRERTERILTHVVASLRALERGDAAAAAHALVEAGEVEEAAWRLDEAEGYFRKALEMGRKPRDRRGEGLALRRLARVARTRGELPAALRLYHAGHDVSVAARDGPGVVVACQGLGNVYVDQGEWLSARQWYLRGVEHLADRRSAEYLHLCNALSVVERRLGNLDESERWLERGEAEAERVDDAAARAYLEHGRARLLMARGELAAGEELLRSILERSGDPIARVSALINLADPLLQQGMLDAAVEALREAEGLGLQIRAVRHLPHVYAQLGKVAGARSDPEGFVFFEQALELIRSHRLSLAQHAEVQHAYGQFEAGLGAGESALARFRIARDQYRSIGAEVEARAVEEEMEALRGLYPDEPGSGQGADKREDSER